MKSKPSNEMKISILSIIRTYPLKISLTWILVLLENILIAFIPFLIGQAIDGLLQKNYSDFKLLVFSLVGLIILSVCRRIYDTRIYSELLLTLCAKVMNQNLQESTSIKNARLDMSKQFALFLEEAFPNTISSCIQLILSLLVLLTFENNLFLSALTSLCLMFLIYSLFHKKLFSLYSAQNDLLEKQVATLSHEDPSLLFQHLKHSSYLRIKVSDSEAWLYGLILISQMLFICFNLWLSSQMPHLTPGSIFSIVTYSWEFIEAAIVFPMSLQEISKLQEISTRITKPSKIVT